MRPLTAELVPRATPETESFWASCAAGFLSFQECQSCGHAYLYPGLRCPHCLSPDVAWRRATGFARLYSYVIENFHSVDAQSPPRVIAVVALEEGPRLMSNLVGVATLPDDLVLDMRLEVTFAQRANMTLPLFRPVGRDGV